MNIYDIAAEKVVEELKKGICPSVIRFSEGATYPTPTINNFKLYNGDVTKKYSESEYIALTTEMVFIPKTQMLTLNIALAIFHDYTIDYVNGGSHATHMKGRVLAQETIEINLPYELGNNLEVKIKDDCGFWTSMTINEDTIYDKIVTPIISFAQNHKTEMGNFWKVNSAGAM